jgi:hypothetical protein
MQVVRDIEASSHVQANHALLLGCVVKVVMMTRPWANVRVKTSHQRRVGSFVASQVPFANNVIGISERQAELIE